MVKVFKETRGGGESGTLGYDHLWIGFKVNIWEKWYLLVECDCRDEDDGGPFLLARPILRVLGAFQLVPTHVLIPYLQRRCRCDCGTLGSMRSVFKRV